MDKFWGKYRGQVVDNQDPLNLGRIQPLVPAIAAQPLNWAMPCTPYAGPQVGWYAIPPVDAQVWIEFEGGDPNYPIWSGCFWGGATQEEGPPPEASGPDVKVLQMAKMVVIFNDESGKLTAKMETDSGPRSIVMSEKGIVLTSDKVTLTITQDKIELAKAPASLELADGITLKKAAASIELSDSIALKNGGASAEIQQASIELKNGAADIKLSPASVNVNNGALEVM
jgi:uncharacterized protein involved in type VI secretion and phage assembly